MYQCGFRSGGGWCGWDQDAAVLFVWRHSQHSLQDGIQQPGWVEGWNQWLELDVNVWLCLQLWRFSAAPLPSTCWRKLAAMCWSVEELCRSRWVAPAGLRLSMGAPEAVQSHWPISHRGKGTWSHTGWRERQITRMPAPMPMPANRLPWERSWKESHSLCCQGSWMKTCSLTQPDTLDSQPTGTEARGGRTD